MTEQEVETLTEFERTPPEDDFVMWCRQYFGTDDLEAIKTVLTEQATRRH